VHWYSLAQFGLSLLAVLGLWGAAASTLIAALSQRLVGDVVVDDLPLFLIAGSLFFTGLLLLPSAGYALARILGRPVELPPPVARLLRPTLLIFAFPLLLAAGYWITQQASLAWLLLPPVHVLAISLPLLWLAYLAIRDLPLGSHQRLWGVFASGATLGPMLIMVAELAALLVGIVLGAAVIASRPELVETLERLISRLQAAPPTSEAVLEIIQPVLSSPGVIFSVIAFAALIVPLIEEALKPVGVWLLAGKGLSPAGGFAAGALSGAGYAVVESLLLTSNTTDWALLVLARVGTGTVHILTSALVGWALVQAWSGGRYLRLGAVYLLAVLVHGLWNGLTLLNAFTSLAPAHAPALGTGWLGQLGGIALPLLGVLAAAAFAALLLANRRLARFK